MLILQRPWDSQPQEAVELSGGPINAGLVGCVWMGGGAAVDLRTRLFPNTTGATVQPGANGLARQVTTAGNNGVFYDRMANPAWRINGPLTMLFFGDFNTPAASTTIAGLTDGGSSLGYYALSQFGTRQRYVRISTDSVLRNVSPGVAWSTGECVRGLTWDGATLRGFDAGAEFGSVAAPGSVTYNGTFSRVRALGDADKAGPSGRMYWMAAWARVLSPAEIASINANPWQIFEPRRIYIPGAAVGGAPAESGGASSTVTVTAAGAGSAVEAASGGASASVSVTAAGAGTAAEQASGGASASVTVSAAGAGSIQASGGASASVVVTAAGAGTASTATSGGASAVVTVSAAGTGTATEAASGGASSAVSVTAAGAGTSSAGASGGSTATVSVSAVGAGTAFQPASGGAGAAVLVTAAGAGLALEIVAGGSSATVTVSAVGGGTDGSIVTGTEYIRLYSRITPAVAALSPICPTIARSSPVGVLRALRSNIDLEST